MFHVIKPVTNPANPSQVNGVAWPSSEPSRSRTPSPPPALPKAAPPSREIIEIDSSSPLEVFENSPSLSSLEVPPELPKTRPPLQVVAEVDGIHQALKAIVTPVGEMAHASFHHQTSEVHRAGSYTIATHSSEVTSDSETSFVNFYDVEHSQVVKKLKNEDIHIPIKATPLGVSYRSFGDNNQTVNGHQNEDQVERARVLTRPDNGSFVKIAPTAKTRNLLQEHPKHSEANSYEESFDAPPRVIHPKKDNTLISKIYKDPRVRLFALHSRDETPSMEESHTFSAFTSQQSVEVKESHSETSSYLSKDRSHSSDDGLTSEYESGKTGRISFFSSEEDLLSLNSESSHVVDTRNQAMVSNEPHFEHYSYTLSPPATPSTKKFIYGSQEDLLSLEEVSCIGPRKDNTIISKIYQDPNVRNFALKTHKNILPESLPSKPKQRLPSVDHAISAESHRKTTKSRRNNELPISSSSSAEISLEHLERQVEDISVYAHEVNNSEPETGDLNVEEIAKRQVVRLALGKFEHAEIRSKRTSFQRISSVDESDRVRVSVRELKNKFESNDNNSKPVVSSLTARSLSKQVKAALKQ